MEQVFLRVLNMSVTAAYVILAVLLLRLLLRRTPKKYSYLLWSVVGFRLACPISFSSVLSLFNALSLPRRAVEGPAINYVTAGIAGAGASAGAPAVSTGLSAADAAVNAVLPAPVPTASVDPAQVWLLGATVLWCVGAALLLAYACLTLWRVRRQVRAAVRSPGGYWECDGIRSPFLLGLFRPRIYLPFGLGEEERAYILAHERCHLCRRDHLVKVLAFLLLVVHWFNPLVWVAFSCMTRDMEMSCDEKVLSRGGADLKRAYSTSLLSFASNRRLAAPTPLAFGETGVKARIRNVLRYRPARRGVAAVCALLCLALVAACASNPVAGGEEPYGRFGIQIALPEDYGGRVTLADPGTLSDNVLLAAYHTASQESAEDGAALGYGWMFSIVRHDYASFEDYWLSYELTGGSNVFARDENYYYSYEFPTDVQFPPELYEEYTALVREFDLDAVVERNGLTPWTQSPWGDVSAYTYPGNHWEFTFTQSTGDQCTLVLSQPVRQGEGGVWCAERWSDAYGNVYLVLPDTDLTAQAYYERLQAAVDAGESALPLPFEVAESYITGVLGQSAQGMTGRELIGGAKGEALDFLTALFADGYTDLWYRGASGDRGRFTLGSGVPNAGAGLNWDLDRMKVLFDEDWERLDQPVQADGNLLLLGDGEDRCFQLHLGTGDVTLVDGEDRTSYRTSDQWGGDVPSGVLMEYSGHEISYENVSVPAQAGETFEQAADRWLAAYRAHLLDTIPESSYALTDMAAVEREVYLTREGDDGIFGFWATLAVKPALEDWNRSPWWAGNTDMGAGDWAGWMVMGRELRLERADGNWHCTGMGTGGLSLD